MDLQNSLRHLELEKLEDQKSLQRADSQIASLEKLSLEDRRDIIEYQEKCKSLEDVNGQLQDQVAIRAYSCPEKDFPCTNRNPTLPFSGQSSFPK